MNCNDTVICCWQKHIILVFVAVNMDSCEADQQLSIDSRMEVILFLFDMIIHYIPTHVHAVQILNMLTLHTPEWRGTFISCCRVGSVTWRFVT